MDQWNMGGPGALSATPSQSSSTDATPGPSTELAPTAPITSETSGSAAPASLSAVGETLRDTLQQAQQRALDTVDTARRQATEQVNAQVNRGLSQTSQSLDAVSDAASQASQRLRERNQGTLADYVDLATGRIDQAAEYLRTSNLNDLLTDAERLIERQPALFVAGAFVVGVLGARFLKSSSHHDDTATGNA